MTAVILDGREKHNEPREGASDSLLHILDVRIPASGAIGVFLHHTGKNLILSIGASAI